MKLDPDSVRIGQLNLHVSEITDIARPFHENSGGKAGALVGALGIGMFTYFLADGFCRPNCSFKDRAVGAGIGITVGASLGGLVGGITHPSQRGWERIWP